MILGSWKTTSVECGYWVQTESKENDIMRKDPSPLLTSQPFPLIVDVQNFQVPQPMDTVAQGR